MQGAMNMQSAVVVTLELQLGTKLSQIPALVLRVHAQRDGGACRQRRQVIVERRRPCTLSAQLGRLIGIQRKMSRMDMMEIVAVGGDDGGKRDTGHEVLLRVICQSQRPQSGDVASVSIGVVQAKHVGSYSRGACNWT